MYEANGHLQVVTLLLISLPAQHLRIKSSMLDSRYIIGSSTLQTFILHVTVFVMLLPKRPTVI